MSITPPPAGRRVPARQSAALLLGAAAHQNPAWWLDPVRAVLFIVLPIFCYAAYFNQYNYWSFGASANFITAQTFHLGLYSLALLLLGIVVGKRAIRRRDVISVIDPDLATRVLIRIGWVTILAYVVLLGALVAHLDLVLQLVRGDVAASSSLREVIGRIPGITSFIQFGVVYLALISALVVMGRFRMPTRLWIMTLTIFVLTFLRSILASERLALLEALAAAFVVPIAFRWRPSPWRVLAPYIGIAFVFLAFAAGEYFRSWQYYKDAYDSYGDFISQRFAGYFSTAINNGAGSYLIFGQYHPHPEVTVTWITHFPGIGALFQTGQEAMLDQFLDAYASPEFNNPGGLYAAFSDYRFPIASLFMIALGAIIGASYRAFENKNLFGLVLYPAVFLGVTDLIRIVYIVDTRTLPIFLGSALVFWGLHPLRVPRGRLPAPGAVGG